MTTLEPNLISNFADVDTPAASELTCAHCGLPVPPDMMERGSTDQFCCTGCRAVYAAIRSAGLDHYYDIRDRVASTDQTPAQTSGSRFDAFDDSQFIEKYARGTETHRSIDFYVEGMHCPACVWLIEQLPAACSGVRQARVNLSSQSVTIDWVPEQTSLSNVARQLDAFGYTPHAYKQRGLQEHRHLEDRRSLVRIAVAGAIAGNVMLISFALYGGMLHGMESIYRNLFHITCAGLTGVAIVWPGRVFFSGAWRALRSGHIHMDVPVAVGLAAGTLWSMVAASIGMESVYFDSMTLLIFLLLIGRWVQQRQQRRSQDALELLFTLTPATARVRRDSHWQETAAETLAVGDLVLVLPGETFPADGVVRSGSTTVDLSLLSGETRPVDISEETEISAGAINLTSPVDVQVIATGEDTRVAHLMKLVEDAAKRRAPIVALADRIAGWFVMIVLLLACMTAGIWMLIDATSAIEHAVALLIITCPCALGLATPLALMTGIGQAARDRILIKGGDVIERLITPGIIYFDKTGTLTRGNLRVIQWFGDVQARTCIAALEQHSSHAIARAILNESKDEQFPPVANVVVHHGLGVAGTVDRQDVRVGSVQYIAPDARSLPETVCEVVVAAQRHGQTVILCERNGRIIGGVVLGDTVRTESGDVIAHLRSIGWRIGMISGDAQHVVDDVARQLNLDADWCHGNVSPEQKLAMIEQAPGETVVMVGDGVNDAAALAAAQVGIAVRGSAEASMAAADVFLARGIEQLPELMHGSHRCFHTIRRNLVVSLCYNVVGVSLAVAGLINPILAAILMPASSLTVMMMSYRSRCFESNTRPSSRSGRSGTP